MERCEVCGRDDYHERHCPNNAGASLFPRDSAFARQSPLFKATFDEEGEPETMQMVASSSNELENLWNDIGLVRQMLERGDVGQALQELEAVQAALYALLR